MLVTGMSGAGKSTALKTFEDMGWEAVDNLPLRLLDRLLETPPPAGANEPDRPLAIGIDSRTRGFDANRLVERVTGSGGGERAIELLFLDCQPAEIERRFHETRRRHPLALDRPVADGVTREAELTEPLRAVADAVIDTTDTTTNALQAEIRARYGDVAEEGTTLLLSSFGFKHGVPRNADLVLDMRFLRNPHWLDELRPLTGHDAAVVAHIAGDPAYAEATARIEELLALLLPRYQAEGKSYVTVAFGCTGGRHRSVHVAEHLASRLRARGFSPTVVHRDLAQDGGVSERR